MLSLILDSSPGAFARLRYLNVCSDTHGEYCQLKNLRYKVHICAENLSATSVILGSFSTHCQTIAVLPVHFVTITGVLDRGV